MTLAIICLSIVPFIFWLCSALFHKKIKLHSDSKTVTEVSAVLIIYNEEKHIYRKTIQIINELNSLDFSKKELIIISDGSTDNFERELDKIDLPQFVKVIKTPARKGKPFSINLAKELASYKNLIFSDARQDITPGSFQAILEPLVQKGIGAVSAKLNNKNKFNPVRGILNLSKYLQSASGKLIGMYGALFAIKKDLLPEVPEETVLDDMYISLHILSQNRKVVMSSKAIITDVRFSSLCAKKRVLRIIAGLLQILNAKNIRSQFSRSVITYYCVAKIYRFIIPLILIFLMANLDVRTLIYILIGCAVALYLFPSVRSILKSFGQVIQSLATIKQHQTVFWNKMESIEP